MLRGYLQEDILVKTDRASMAASLELRAPFLDPRLIDFLLLSMVMLLMLAANSVQIGWAAVFVALGEFSHFQTAAVDFVTLDYGDIVMSDRWRMLGPMANGILMFGVSIAVMTPP